MRFLKFRLFYKFSLTASPEAKRDLWRNLGPEYRAMVIGLSQRKLWRQLRPETKAVFQKPRLSQ